MKDVTIEIKCETCKHFLVDEKLINLAPNITKSVSTRYYCTRHSSKLSFVRDSSKCKRFMKRDTEGERVEQKNW